MFALAAPLIRRLNHPALPCLLVAVLYSLFLMRALEQRDAAEFVQAGGRFTDTTQTPPNLFTVTPHAGYDGQFYYRLAITPFSSENPAFGITFDLPRYRHQRILYPLLAYGLSFGSPPLAIYSLILVNFLALAVLGWVGGVYAQAAGRHALWGAAFALYAGYLLSLSRNLAEIVEAGLVLGGLAALQRQRWPLAAALLALAVLAKETALLAVVVLAGWWAWARWRRAPGPPLYVGLVPVAVYAGWQAWLIVQWGPATMGVLGNNLGWPLLGVLDGYRWAAPLFPGAATLWAVEAAALGIFTLGVALSLRQSRASAVEKLGWGAALGLLLVLSGHVWIEDWAFLRAASLFYLFGVTVLLNARGWLAGGLLAGGTVAWGVLAGQLLTFR